MCGIAGFAGFSLTEQEMQGRVRAMCDAITHRGPDSAGYFVADGIAMGMRRLSIIDVHGGSQPITNEDGSITVVFNGEIYNHHALRQRLMAAGHTFRTHSDTEVLVHLYEEIGPDMTTELHGMFAFSIWDARLQRLFIARDRTGMKPLSYHLSPDGIVYGSELRSLLTLPSHTLTVSAASVMQYLAFGYVPDPNSIFEGVRKLPPGHMLLWTARQGMSVRRYWRPPTPDTRTMDESTLIETLQNKLDHAVASHLESEVPLGAFLSGGLDSSTVVALMSRHATGRVKTFSIGFPEADYDESGTARAVANAFGTDHTELIVQPDVEHMFEDIVSMFDEPFGDSSAIPTFLVAQLARKSVTVALSGDGGDELFGGYSRYRDTLRQSSLPRSLATLAEAIGRQLPHSALGKNKLIDLGRNAWGRYAARVLLPVNIGEGGVGNPNLSGGRHLIAQQLNDYLTECTGSDFTAELMRLDLQTYLPGDILTKVDRTSMAVSLEARVPLLDADLVDFALSIPGHLRVTPRETKQLFRKAIRGMVPEFVLNGPKKGFAIPLNTWFRGPLRHHIESLGTAATNLGPYVDRAATKRLVDEHIVGRRDHSGMLWRLLVLDHWLSALAHGKLARPPVTPYAQAA